METIQRRHPTTQGQHRPRGRSKEPAAGNSTPIHQQTTALALEAVLARLATATAGIPLEALAQEPSADVLAKAALGMGSPDEVTPAPQPQFTLRVSQLDSKELASFAIGSAPAVARCCASSFRLQLHPILDRVVNINVSTSGEVRLWNGFCPSTLSEKY